VNQGHICHTADGAEEALLLLNTKSIDLALVDVIMPGMTGLSLFKQIKEIYPDTAIVFVTSVDDMNLAFDSVKNGAYDYIIKSTIPHQIVETVEQALCWREANMIRERRMRNLQAMAEHQVADIRLHSQRLASSN